MNIAVAQVSGLGTRPIKGTWSGRIPHAERATDASLTVKGAVVIGLVIMVIEDP